MYNLADGSDETERRRRGCGKTAAHDMIARQSHTLKPLKI